VPVARSRIEPERPFVDTSVAPLVCPPRGSAIDASPFVSDDGRAFLIWKHDERGRTGIVAQQLTSDGLGLVGPRRLLLQADQPWEGGNIEGPSMVAHDGRDYLCYSGNDFESANYAIGYAICQTPFGPCEKAPGPWLGSSAQAEGPGGQEVLSDGDGHLWLALHAWIRGHIGYPGGARNLFVLTLTFVNSAPVAG
jgi:beta-xylosidase